MCKAKSDSGVEGYSLGPKYYCVECRWETSGEVSLDNPGNHRCPRCHRVLHVCKKCKKATSQSIVDGVLTCDGCPKTAN